MGNSQPPVPVGTAQAVRDIFLAAINKGQFLTAILGLILLVIVWRLPGADLSALVRSVLDSLVAGYLLGYALFVVTLGGWYVHARKMRVMGTTEQIRIGNEKTALQKDRLGTRVRSSKK